MDVLDEFENITNSTFEEDVITGEVTTYDVVWEIIFAILCIFLICLNCLIIYTIFRYKKLHSVPNILIANWSICDIFILITLRSNYKIVMLMHNGDIPHWMINVLHLSQYSLRNTYLLFVLAVTIDWHLVSYFATSASEKFRNNYKYTIIFIWLLNPLLLFTSIGLSFPVFIMFVYLITYLGLWVYIISLYSFIRIQKFRKKLSDYPIVMLKLATFLILCWVPVWLSIPLSLEFYVYGWPLIECCYLATSVVTFTVLYRTNRDFQACFEQAIKCSRNRYEEEISEFQSFPENITSEYQSTQPHLYKNGEKCY